MLYNNLEKKPEKLTTAKQQFGMLGILPVPKCYAALTQFAREATHVIPLFVIHNWERCGKEENVQNRETLDRSDWDLCRFLQLVVNFSCSRTIIWLAIF